MPKPNHIEGMVEVHLSRPDSFAILRETLTRIGVQNKDGNRLYQTCHILCKRKKYYIVHFKELFLLDDKPTNMTVTDVARRNSIINYLLERKFFVLASGQECLEPYLPRTERSDNFTIITHEDKAKWELVPKYVIGKSKGKKPKKAKTTDSAATSTPTS